MTIAVLIPCGRAKRPYPAAAGDLYVGGTFRLGRSAAAAIGADLFIVSGGHGVVPAAAVLAPYDRQMSPDGTAARPSDPATIADVNRHSLIISLLPQAYRRHTSGAGIAADLDALIGCGGIGEQRSVLSALARGRVRVRASGPRHIAAAMLTQHRISGQPASGLLVTHSESGGRWTGRHTRHTSDQPGPWPAGEHAWLLPLDSLGHDLLPAVRARLHGAGTHTTALPLPPDRATARPGPLLAWAADPLTDDQPLAAEPLSRPTHGRTR